MPSRPTIEIPAVRIPLRNDYVERHDAYVARREDLTETRVCLPTVDAFILALPDPRPKQRNFYTELADTQVLPVIDDDSETTTDTGERTMELYGLHGDLRIERLGDVGVAEGALTPVRDYVIAGSHDGAHTIVGAAEVGAKSSDGYMTVRIAADTTLTHATRHLPMPLVAGDYLIGPQRERGAGVDRAVED